MKIIYFCSRLTLRTERFAINAINSGHQIILCLQDEDSLSLTDSHDYESIYYHNGEKDGIINAYVKALSHKPDLLHIFISFAQHEAGKIIATISTLPKIGDSYDMVNAQYTETAYTYKEYSDLESAWISKCDGFTLRSPYYRSLKKIKKNIPFVLLPELFTTKNNQNTQTKLNSYDRKTHLLYLIDLDLADGDPTHLLKILNAVKELDYIIYILEWPSLITPQEVKDRLLSHYSFIRFIPFLPNESFVKFLAKCDMVIQGTELAAVAKKGGLYRKDCAPFFFSNKYIEAIEVNTPFIFPKIQKFAYNFTHKFVKCFYFRQEDLSSTAFWLDIKAQTEHKEKVNYDKVKNKQSRDAKRLHTFYRQIAKNNLGL